jgi:hypothetical protein
LSTASQAAGAQDPQQLRPVADVVRALGVEEDHVLAGVRRRGERVGGVLNAQLDEGLEAGAGEVGGRLRAARGLQLDRDDAAAGGAHGVGEPQRRVAVRRAELENGARRGGAHQQRE